MDQMQFGEIGEVGLTDHKVAPLSLDPFLSTRAFIRTMLARIFHARKQFKLTN